MSNSKLVSYTKISPNSTNPRNHKIDKITIHHMAGNLSVETCANVFQGSRQASSNYGVGTDGRVALYVDEANRAWTSSNRANDMRAVTIEVANDGGAPDWHVSDKALEATIALCVDICQRNGIAALNFTGDASGNLTMHKWFAATSCPGPYLESKFPYIAQEVNRRLNGAQPEPEEEEKEPAGSTLYRVQVGAYKVKANADKQLEKVKAAGFDTYMVRVDGLYKIQTGAYSKKANAEAQLAKVKAAGFSAFITTKSGTAVGSTEEAATNWWDSVKHFDRDEFKCKCGGKYCNGYPAEPAKLLVQVADRVREHFGAPATVSSGVRCKTHNANVGGATASRHMSGKAMDFCVRGKTAAQVLAYVKQQPEIRYAYAIDSRYVHMDIE